MAGVMFVILMIKTATDVDNKAKYLKLTKHLIIATILITLSLTLVEIPKHYFGSTVEITDGQGTQITFGKIEDKDCKDREVVNIDGRRYVVTDTNKKIVSMSDDEELSEAYGINIGGNMVENISYLRPFGDCQGFWKGFYAKIEYYRDSDGCIFPANSTYSQYLSIKEQTKNFTNNGGDGARRRCKSVVDKKTIRIPAEIKLKTEFFDGYGMSELIKTIIVGGIASFVAYIIYLITKQTLFSTFFVLGAIVISVIALIKGQNNFSMVDSIKNLVKFSLMQQEYKYRRGDFIEKSISKIE